ncbi:ankyrin [Xylaria telfairii]|nr:ankyrin [Xylaria telfairii]
MATLHPSSNMEEEEWDRHKSLIISLYLGMDNEESGGQIKGKTLSEVAEFMRGYGFNASVSQIEVRLNAWGARKNLKPEEWEQVHQRLDMLPHGTRSRVLISGRVVADSKINRARRYRKQKFRIANSAPTGGSNFSALSHQVHIEVQTPHGRWVQLQTADTVATPLIPHSPSVAIAEEACITELSIPSPIPIISTSSRSPARVSHCSPDISGLSGESIKEYQMEDPTTWLGSLPSRRIINTMCEYGFHGVVSPGNTAQIRAMFTRVFKWDNVLSNYRLSDASLQSPNAILSGRDSRDQNEQNQRIMAPDDACRFKFNQFLLLAIMSGTCEPRQIPEEVLRGLFGPGSAVNSLLLHCLKDAPYLISTRLLSALLYALILRGKRDAIAQLLDKRLVHADNTVIFARDGRLTPIEAAAQERDEELVGLLLSYGGDPNKSYRSFLDHYTGRLIAGALESVFSDPVFSGPVFLASRKEPPSLNILHKLIEAGAEVRPNMCVSISELDETRASFMILQIKPSQHEEYFEHGFWTEVLPCGDDIHTATLVSQVVSDCVERHSGRCISRHQDDVDRGLAIAALKGRIKTFLAILPHSTSTSSSLNEKLLSASVRGGQSIIIDSVMKRRPNINPSHHDLITAHYDPNARETTPLAELIRAKNTEMIEYFARMGIFEALHTDGQFGPALCAAVEIGDTDLVTCMLRSCPDLESQYTGNALHCALSQGHEALALLLLEEGASVYSAPFSSERETDDPISLAVREGNKKVVEGLLKIGRRRDYEQPRELCQWLMDPDVMEDYLSSYPCEFRYEIPWDVSDPDSSPIISALEDTRMYDRILDSKLATRELLTTCLGTAICKNKAIIVQDLINKGADTLNETVLACAARWGTGNLFQLVLDRMNHPTPVVTKGLRTTVLKEAIKQGPDKYEVVCQLIKSGLVDIFDTGYPVHGRERNTTPLGVAIRVSQDKSSKQFSYDVAKLLLCSGSDPDGIVSFGNGYPILTNQTAMLLAIEIRNQELVKLLIESGANVNLELRHLVRRTPLQKAAEEGDLEMVRLLLQYGAEVNAKPAIALGGTALQLAAISGNCELACELLSRGASLYMPPPKIGGRWPIEGAAEHGRLEMIQFLWNAKEGTIFLSYDDNGFREKNFKKAMRLARGNNYYLCVELIAQLAKLPVTATDLPPPESPPIYVDWPPPGRPAD